MRLAVAGLVLVLACVSFVYAGPYDAIAPPTPSPPSLVPVQTSSGGSGGGGGSSGGGTNSNSLSGSPSQSNTNANTGTNNLLQVPPATNPTVPGPSDIPPDEISPDYTDYETLASEEPSAAALSMTTIVLLILVPVLIGVAAWYVLTHRKHPQTPTESFGTLQPPEDQFPSLQMEQPTSSGPLHTLMMSGAPPTQSLAHMQFDPTTLRKAKQYVASLRGQNIPDHKIARAMREADWPAAYIEEAMKNSEDGGI